MKKSWVICLSLLLISLAWAGSARAAIYTGSITGGDGLTGTAIWDTAVLSWTVEDESVPGMWKYCYTFTVERKAPSHVLLETALGFRKKNVGPGSTPGSELKWYGPEDRSNPGIPSELYGFKWEARGNKHSFSWTLVSDRTPAWVDFYAKDGKHRGEWVLAHNTGFGDEPADQTVTDGNNGGWVLGPGLTAEELAILSFAAQSFGRIRGLVAPGDTDPAQARIVGNHVEVSSENWTYVLDSAGHQVFRPAAVYPHLAASFDTDLTPWLEEWLELPADPAITEQAREMALAAFGVNYFDNPDVNVVTKREVIISQGPDMELPRFHEGRTYVIFSDESRVAGTAETSIIFTPEGQTLHLECSVINDLLSDIVPDFQEGLAEEAIQGIFKEYYDPILRLGTFYNPEEARFPLNASYYRGEEFLTMYPVGFCDPEDDTCNPWYGYSPLGLCFGIPLPWPMWVQRAQDEHRFRCWHWWNRCGRVGSFSGNYDWSASQWAMTDRKLVLNKAFTEYGVSGGVNVQVNHHVFCEGHPDELAIDLMATHGKKLDDHFYEDLESCHVAMFCTHMGPLDPNPFDGVSYYTHHMLRGFRDGTYDDWFMLHQEGDDGLGRGRLRHLLLEGCSSMNWLYAPKVGQPVNLFQDWFNNHVADGIRTVCGVDGEYGGGDINGWLFFRHYNINSSISHAWAMHALDLDACANHPVTVAYGATLDETASILFDGRFSKERGNTGWIIAVETFTVGCL